MAQIVDGCTEDRSHPGQPWCDRKAAYVARLRTHVADGDTAIVRVSLADKLHNARALVTDVRREGRSYFEHFNAGVACQLWYYRSLVEAVGSSNGRNAPELVRAVGELEDLCEGG